MQKLKEDSQANSIHIRKTQIQSLERLDASSLVLSSISVVHVRNGNVRRKVLVRENVLWKLAKEDFDKITCVVYVDLCRRLFSGVQNATQLFLSCRCSRFSEFENKELFSMISISQKWIKLPEHSFFVYIDSYRLNQRIQPLELVHIERCPKALSSLFRLPLFYVQLPAFLDERKLQCCRKKTLQSFFEKVFFLWPRTEVYSPVNPRRFTSISLNTARKIAVCQRHYSHPSL